MPDASQELPLLRRLAVAVLESRRSGNQETVSALLAEWQEMQSWGVGGTALDFDLGVALDVVVDSNGSVSKTESSTTSQNSPIVSLGDRRAKNRATPERRKDARRTWLSPYFSAYRQAYKSEPVGVTVGRMARTLKALEIAHPREEVAAHFKNFCASTPARWFSVEKFCDTYPAWDKQHSNSKAKGGPPDPEPGESVDAYIVRLAKLGY